MKRTRRTFGTIRLFPSGRFQASYIDPTGHRVVGPTTFMLKADAAKWLAMREAEIVEHRWKPAAPDAPVSLTVEEFATAWMRDRVHLSPLTLVGYRRDLRTKILPTFGARQIREVTPADVRKWHKALNPAHRTARAHAYALLHAIFEGALNDEVVDSTPCRIKAGSAVTGPKKQIRPATLEQLETITLAMPPKYRAMILLASWCAMRFGEITELRRTDLDLDGDVPMIHITREVVWPDASTPVVKDPKSYAGTRDVTIPPPLVDVLREHVDQFAAPGDDGLLFPNRKGGHLHHGSLYKVFKPARAKAGRTDLRFHELRHTGAVLAALSGATIIELMERLGHSTPAMAMRYQHVAEGRQAALAIKLGEAMMGQ